MGDTARPRPPPVLQQVRAAMARGVTVRHSGCRCGSREDAGVHLERVMTLAYQLMPVEGGDIL